MKPSAIADIKNLSVQRVFTSKVAECRELAVSLLGETQVAQEPVTPAQA